MNNPKLESWIGRLRAIQKSTKPLNSICDKLIKKIKKIDAKKEVSMPLARELCDSLTKLISGCESCNENFKAKDGIHMSLSGPLTSGNVCSTLKHILGKDD